MTQSLEWKGLRLTCEDFVMTSLQERHTARLRGAVRNKSESLAECGIGLTRTKSNLAGSGCEYIDFAGLSKGAVFDARRKIDPVDVSVGRSN